MGKLEKLIRKLQNGTIKADELRTLMRQLGWVLVRQAGSHEQWANTEKDEPHNKLTLATHSKELKPYQIKEARRRVLNENI